MKIPQQIRAGDTIKWRDCATTDVFGNAVSSDDYDLNYYLRFIDVAETVTVSGAAFEQGWEFTISAATSAAFYAGQWFWQAVATRNSEKLTLGAGQLTVLPTLDTAGRAAFDGRTQAQKDLEAVQSAMRAMVSGSPVQEYTIGNRRLKKMLMADLIMLESKLKADVMREQRAMLINNGMGDPTKLYVRFTG